MTWDELPVGTTMERPLTQAKYLKMDKTRKHLSLIRGEGFEFRLEEGMHGDDEVDFKLFDNWRHFPQEFFE